MILSTVGLGLKPQSDSHEFIDDIVTIPKICKFSIFLRSYCEFWQNCYMFGQSLKRCSDIWTICYELVANVLHNLVALKLREPMLLPPFTSKLRCCCKFLLFSVICYNLLQVCGRFLVMYYNVLTR